MQKAACREVLKNLPVTFTFAPMNLLHYRVAFPPKSKRLVTVAYEQYAYVDTAGKGSYQLAYVLHPATLWKDFGPIHLTVQRKGVACKASVPLKPAGEVTNPSDLSPILPSTKDMYDVYSATLTESRDKSGELFVGIDKAGWDNPEQKPARQSKE